MIGNVHWRFKKTNHERCRWLVRARAFSRSPNYCFVFSKPLNGPGGRNNFRLGCLCCSGRQATRARVGQWFRPSPWLVSRAGFGVACVRRNSCNILRPFPNRWFHRVWVPGRLDLPGRHHFTESGRQKRSGGPRVRYPHMFQHFRQALAAGFDSPLWIPCHYRWCLDGNAQLTRTVLVEGAVYGNAHSARGIPEGDTPWALWAFWMPCTWILRMEKFNARLLMRCCVKTAL